MLYSLFDISVSIIIKHAIVKWFTACSSFTCNLTFYNKSVLGYHHKHSDYHHLISELDVSHHQVLKNCGINYISFFVDFACITHIDIIIISGITPVPSLIILELITFLYLSNSSPVSISLLKWWLVFGFTTFVTDIKTSTIGMMGWIRFIDH